MRAGIHGALLTLGLASAIVATSAGDARANGDATQAETFTAEGKGVDVTSAGVGLSGRRAIGADVPVTKGDIVITGVPSGATVQKAYLYWVVYGGTGDENVTLDGTAIPGTLAGTSNHTCWGKYPDTYKNRVYRADVTAMIAGNGTYTLTDFPSALPTQDTQGASIVVVYDDPASNTFGTVILIDGAVTVDPLNSGAANFTGLQVSPDLVSATLHVGVGDGQPDFADGSFRFDNKLIPVPAAGYWPGNDGTYWDDASFDVSTYIDSSNVQAGWDQSYFNDCIIFAFTALEMQSTSGTGGDGGSSGNGGSSGAGGGSSGNGGSSGAGGGSSGNGGSSGGSSGNGGTSGNGGSSGSGGSSSSDRGSSGDDGGCNCETGAGASGESPAGALIFGLAIAAIGARRRRHI